MSDLTLVRATVRMVGVDLHENVFVNTDDPEIQVYLDKGYLVPVGPTAEPPASEDADEDDPLAAARAAAFAAPIDDVSAQPSV